MAPTNGQLDIKPQQLPLNVFQCMGDWTIFFKACSCITHLPWSKHALMALQADLNFLRWLWPDTQ